MNHTVVLSTGQLKAAQRHTMCLHKRKNKGRRQDKIKMNRLLLFSATLTLPFSSSLTIWSSAYFISLLFMYSFSYCTISHCTFHIWCITSYNFLIRRNIHLITGVLFPMFEILNLFTMFLFCYLKACLHSGSSILNY